MPNIKSAKKRVKVIETKTLRNQMVKSALRMAIKRKQRLLLRLLLKKLTRQLPRVL